MRHINEILKIIKSTKGIVRDTDLAKLFNVKPHTVSTWRKRESIPYDMIISFCEKEKIDLSWLLIGETALKYTDASKDTSAGYEKSEVVKVNFYAPAGKTDGKGLIKKNPIGNINIPKYLYEPSIVVIKTRDKGMEPSVVEGAFAGIDEEDKEIISGKIYAVWLPNEGSVLRRIFTDIDKIILKPDNPLFPVIPVLPEDIKKKTPILGRLRWVIQLL